MKLLSAESSLAKQQAKVNWLQMGDRNTTFYHAKIKQKRARNQELSICNQDGERVTDVKDMQEIFLNFYPGMLGKSPENLSIPKLSYMQNGPILSAEHQRILSAPILPNEIKDALFSIGDEKAPGPDGFSADFFKATWLIIHEEFTDRKSVV